MKKILFIIFTFLVFSNVKAEVYYSEYGEFSSFDENMIEVTDTIDVDMERRYKIYKELYDDGGYYIENNNPTNLPYINKSDYIVTEFSDWDITIPNKIINRKIEEKMFYEYNNMKKVRYVHLYDFLGTDGKFIITELEVYIDGKKINYTYDCTNCNDHFDDYIQNGITTEAKSYILNDTGYLKIDLGNYYSLEIIELHCYFYDEEESTKELSIRFTRDSNFESRVYSDTKIYTKFNNSLPIDVIMPNKYNINHFKIIDPEYEDSVITPDEVKESKVRKVQSYLMYRYQDIKYRYFNYEKVYADGYYSSVNNEYNLIDMNDYKDYYRYRVREKVSISDDLVIKNKNFNLYNFILESTVSDIQINSNINYDINGIYDVNFILPFNDIDKKVIVNIFENDYNMLLKKNKELNNLYEELLKKDDLTTEELNKLLDFREDISKEIEIYENKIKELNNVLNNITNDNLDKDNSIESLVGQIKDLEIEKKELEQTMIKLKNNISEIEFKLKEKNKEIDELIKVINDQKKIINSNKTLNDKYEKIKLENKKLLDDIKVYKKNIKDNEKTISSLNKQINSDNKKIDKLNKKILDLNDDINNYKDKLKNKNEEIKLLKKEIKDLKKQISDYEKEIMKNQKNYNKSITDLQTQIDELMTNNNNLKQIILEKDKKIEDLNESYKTECNLRITKMQNIIDDSIIINDTLNRKIINQNEKLNSIKEINNINLIGYNEKIDILNLKIKNLEDKNDNLNEFYSSCLENEKQSQMINKQLIDNNRKRNFLIFIIIVITLLVIGFLIKEKYKKM